MQIDKNITYELGHYTFQNFTTLNDEQVKQVWEWRNHDIIRKYMYNSDIIPFERHVKFMASLSSREDVSYWLVSKGNSIIGVSNLTSIDLIAEKAELGYYMIPEMINSGLGLEFAYTNILFAFSLIGCQTLFGGIDKRNINAIMLDSYLGCKLNDDDIYNIKNIKYIGWIIRSKDFLLNKDRLNDFREFVRYVKANKEYFNNIKEYAGQF